MYCSMFNAMLYYSREEATKTVQLLHKKFQFKSVKKYFLHSIHVLSLKLQISGRDYMNIISK